MDNALVTCPDCGTPNFSPRGLKAHRGNLNCQRRLTAAAEAAADALPATRFSPLTTPSKPMSKALAKTSPTTIDIEPAAAAPDPWAKARLFVEHATLFQRASLAAQIMAGFELLALHKSLGMRQGKRSDRNFPHSAGSWEKAVKTELGISADTASRWMGMAKEAKPRLSKGDLDLGAILEKHPGALTPAEQELLKKAVHKISDGRTQMEFLIDCGAIPGEVGGDRRKRDDDGKPLPSEKEHAPLACPDWAQGNPAEKALWESLQTEGQRLAFIDWRPRLQSMLNQVKDPRRGFLADMDDATKGDLVATFVEVLGFVAPHVLKHAPKA